jgi:hypothetical protein
MNAAANNPVDSSAISQVNLVSLNQTPNTARNHRDLQVRRDRSQPRERRREHHTHIPDIHGEVQPVQDVVDDARGDHQARVDGPADDSAERVPCCWVEPVPEFLVTGRELGLRGGRGSGDVRRSHPLRGLLWLGYCTCDSVSYLQASVPGLALQVEPRITRTQKNAKSSTITFPAYTEEPHSQLVNDTLMPDHGKQPTGNRRGRDDGEDGKLEQGRGVGDCLFRYVGYRISDGHDGREGKLRCSCDSWTLAALPDGWK